MQVSRSNFVSLVVGALVIGAWFLSGAVPVAQAYEYVICESDNDRYRRCPVGGFRDLRDAEIRVVAKFSKSGCNEGRSWGVERNAIWVDNGCRARFEINYDGYRSNQSWNQGHNWDPYGRYHGHDSYDRYDRDSRFDDYRGAKAQKELEYERARLERERIRLEQEKLAHAQAQAQAQAQGCPPGSRPGRCSDSDRRYGCRDWRAPNGVGCRSN
jgi:hypothetical protein